MTVRVANTIPDVVAGFAARTGSPALRGVGGAPGLAYPELAEIVRMTGRRLTEAGIGQGDVVMLAAADGPAALLALLATASVATVLPVPAQDHEADYEADESVHKAS